MSDKIPPSPLTPKIQSLVSKAPPKPAPQIYDVGGGLSKAWLWVVVASWWITTLVVAFVLGGRLL